MANRIDGEMSKGRSFRIDFLLLYFIRFNNLRINQRDKEKKLKEREGEKKIRRGRERRENLEEARIERKT